MPLVSMCGDEGVERKKRQEFPSLEVDMNRPESSMSWVICTEDLLV